MWKTNKEEYYNRLSNNHLLKSFSEENILSQLKKLV
jgi:hypothetical protein